jgi:PIN like domain
VITRLYVENNVGRAVMDAINLFTPKHGLTAVWQHDVHPEMQRKQNGDEWWIKDVASHGMAVLTQDQTILGITQAAEGRTTSERQAVIDNGAHIIAFGQARYSDWNKLRCLLNHWDAVAKLLREEGPRAITLLLTKATPIELP